MGNEDLGDLGEAFVTGGDFNVEASWDRRVVDNVGGLGTVVLPFDGCIALAGVFLGPVFESRALPSEIAPLSFTSAGLRVAESSTAETDFSGCSLCLSLVGIKTGLFGDGCSPSLLLSSGIGVGNADTAACSGTVSGR